MIASLLIRDRYALFALLLSGSLLCGAWFFEYVLGYAPCTMCYWQRHAHKVVLGVALLSLIYGRVKGGVPLWGVALIVLAFLGSVYFAGWHVGVERGIFEELKICTSGPTQLPSSGADLMNALEGKIKPPACSEVVWSFLGLSMAGWNLLASLFGAAIGGLVIARRRA